MDTLTGEDRLTVDESFNALRGFLELYWQRGFLRSDQIATLLAGMDRGPGDELMPEDLALWHDWLAVCAEAKRKPPEPQDG